LDEGAALDSAPKLAIGDACRVCSLAANDSQLTSCDIRQSAVRCGHGRIIAEGYLTVALDFSREPAALVSPSSAFV
jgi:hypothetical protein